MMHVMCQSCRTESIMPGCWPVYFFVRAQRHFDCARIPVVGHGFPPFDAGKDVVDALGFGNADSR